MLRGPLKPVDPVGEADPRETQRVVAMEAMGGDLDKEPVGIFLELGVDLEVFRMAEAVGVFVPEAGDFPAVEILHFDGEKDKVVAKSGDDTLGLQVARVDEELDAISPAEVPFAHFLKRAPHIESKAELFKVPGGVDIGKRLFVQEVCRRRQGDSSFPA